MIEIQTDFETGSLGMWQVLDDRIRVLPFRDYSHEGRNWTGIWCHFRVAGAKGRRLTLEFADLLDEWQYGASFAWGPNTRPVYSTDGGDTWQRLENCTYDKSRHRLLVEHEFESDCVSIAQIEPYGVSQLQALIADTQGTPGLTVGSIGQSVDGNDLPMLTFGDPADSNLRRVWLVARQHPWEAGTSFAAEGLIRFLASDAPEAQRIREKISFVILPMMNPDGVLRGGTRYNARGYDPMRNIEDAAESDNLESWLLMRAIRAAQAKGQGSELLMNLHNNNQEARDLVGGYHLENDDPRLLSIGHAIARNTFFRGQVFGWGHSNASMPAECGFGALLELQTGYIRALGRYVTASDQMDYGRGLAFAAEDFFDGAADTA